LALAFAWAAAATETLSAGDATSLLTRYCHDCHDSNLQKGGLDLESLGAFSANHDPIVWEKILRKLDHRQMPPAGEARPSESDYAQAVAELSSALDQASLAHPRPGRTDALRRLKSHRVPQRHPRFAGRHDRPHGATAERRA
jgi:hypothetical protein